MKLIRKKHPNRKRRDWEGVARVCADAAQDESVNPALRGYYAALALYADKKIADRT